MRVLLRKQAGALKEHYAANPGLLAPEAIPEGPRAARAPRRAGERAARVAAPGARRPRPVPPTGAAQGTRGWFEVRARAKLYI